ncbi:hypothetical protein VV869_18710, partial [Photobacterium sp. MCCC 1A19761]|uniref:hypothetical protein n=1 Tax=Photobacterium sp. MCCC 1A19761 TaxID=3115000 RepID=UPI00307CD6C1
MLKGSSKWSGGYWPVVVVVFSLLFLPNAFGLLIGWFHSVDVKGWWSLSLVLSSIISMLYASAFSKVMTRPGRTHFLFIVTYNLILASLLLLKSYLFYTVEIDWLKVNSGEIELSFYQGVVHSDSTFYVLYGVF